MSLFSAAEKSPQLNPEAAQSVQERQAVVGQAVVNAINALAESGTYDVQPQQRFENTDQRDDHALAA